MNTLIDRAMNWKMTAFGGGVGAVCAATVSYILITQAQCDFTKVSAAATLAFLGSQLVGLVGTDNGKGVGAAAPTDVKS